LVKFGIPRNRITYTGFPIHPKFTRDQIMQSQARKKLNIDLNSFTVLMTGGGVGAGNMKEWVNTLKRECRDKQLLVITGNNKQLYNELMSSENSSDSIHVYGFVNNMEILMSASDIIISKAGPGTIMEGITTKRPLIITEAVGIQETGNIDYITKRRLGYFCPDPIAACTIINKIANQSRQGDKAHHSFEIITDGSMRIADNLLDQLADIESRHLSEENGTIFLGA